MNNLQKLADAVKARIESGNYLAITSWDQDDEKYSAGVAAVRAGEAKKLYPNLDEYKLSFSVVCGIGTDQDRAQAGIMNIASEVHRKLNAISAELLESDTGVGVVGVFTGDTVFSNTEDECRAELDIDIYVSGFEFEPTAE